MLGLDRVAEAVGQALELLHDAGDALEVGEGEEGVHDVHVGQGVADDLHLGVLAQGGRSQLPGLGVDVAHAHPLEEVHAVAADAHVHGAVAGHDLVARRHRAQALLGQRRRDVDPGGLVVDAAAGLREQVLGPGVVDAGAAGLEDLEGGLVDGGELAFAEDVDRGEAPQVAVLHGSSSQAAPTKVFASSTAPGAAGS